MAVLGVMVFEMEVLLSVCEFVANDCDNLAILVLMSMSKNCSSLKLLVGWGLWHMGYFMPNLVYVYVSNIYELYIL